MRQWLAYHRWRRTLGHWAIDLTSRGYELRWSVPMGDWYFYAPNVWSDWSDVLAVAQSWNASHRMHPSRMGACRETFPDLRASQAA